MTVETLGRAVSAYRRTAASRSAILLVVANLIPLVGVLLFGWSLWTILVLYWVENGIVGLWNVPKLLLAQGTVLGTLPELPDPTAARDRNLAVGRVRVFGQPVGGSAGRVGLAIFFLTHYGIFWLVHGIFIFMLPTFFGAGGCEGLGPGDLTFGPDGFPIPVDAACGGFGDIAWNNVVIAAVALFISHGASFLFNFVGRGEYLTTSPMRAMSAPYGRVVILHLTILFGTFVVVTLGTPIGALLILVALKTALDLTLHLRERRKADARVPADTAYGQVVGGS